MKYWTSSNGYYYIQEFYPSVWFSHLCRKCLGKREITTTATPLRVKTGKPELMLPWELNHGVCS